MGGAQVVRCGGGVWEGTKTGCRWRGAGMRCEKGSRDRFGSLGAAAQMGVQRGGAAGGRVSVKGYGGRICQGLKRRGALAAHHLPNC